jgi:hypothetical protein
MQKPTDRCSGIGPDSLRQQPVQNRLQDTIVRIVGGELVKRAPEPATIHGRAADLLRQSQPPAQGRQIVFEGLLGSDRSDTKQPRVRVQKSRMNTSSRRTFLAHPHCAARHLNCTADMRSYPEGLQPRRTVDPANRAQTPSGAGSGIIDGGAGLGWPALAAGDVARRHQGTTARTLRRASRAGGRWRDVRQQPPSTG